MPDIAVPAITRRQGLIALALIGPAGLLAACTSTSEPSSEASAGTTAPVDAVATQEGELVAQYEAVLAAFPSLAADATVVLTSIRDEHKQHRDALGGTTTEAATAAAPASIDAAITSLIAAERTASRDRVTACVDAPSADAARLLAFIGASEASHVPALRDLRA
jgi:hypothetical protein